MGWQGISPSKFPRKRSLQLQWQQENLLESSPTTNSSSNATSGVEEGDVAAGQEDEAERDESTAEPQEEDHESPINDDGHAGELGASGQLREQEHQPSAEEPSTPAAAAAASVAATNTSSSAPGTPPQPWERDMPGYRGTRPIPDEVQNLADVLLGRDTEPSYFSQGGTAHYNRLIRDFNPKKKNHKYTTDNFNHRDGNIAGDEELLDFWKDTRLLSEEQWLALVKPRKSWPVQRFKDEYKAAKNKQKTTTAGNWDKKSSNAAKTNNNENEVKIQPESSSDEVSARKRGKMEANSSELHRSHEEDEERSLEPLSNNEDMPPSQGDSGQAIVPDLGEYQKDFDEGKAMEKALRRSKRHQFGEYGIQGG